jgi:uncharacterized protein YjiS (DUF1127 family)
MEAEMKVIATPMVDAIQTQASPTTPSYQATIRKFLRNLGHRFSSANDLRQLSPRLLKDAGIDEQEMERKRVAAAPLIRS